MPSKKPVDRRKKVMITIKPELHEELRQLAERHNVSVSRMVENLVIAGLLRDAKDGRPGAVF